MAAFEITKSDDELSANPLPDGKFAAKATAIGPYSRISFALRSSLSAEGFSDSLFGFNKIEYSDKHCRITYIIRIPHRNSP